MNLRCKLWTHDWECVTDPETRRFTDTRVCLRCGRVDVLLDYTFGESSWVEREYAEAAIERRISRQMKARRIASSKSEGSHG